jgi:hypothetical protein
MIEKNNIYSMMMKDMRYNIKKLYILGWLMVISWIFFIYCAMGEPKLW